ncbi:MULTISPECIES: hypothetical protein [Pseudanabaena]|jgi:hypothetical protein|uniref:hypothetical protein n=1 Tax=Pseudanabaena TaxID=1152 RepID=UPI00247A85C7|nr:MULTISPECIES: hypothetical protein [Pseudanabaena]MEA5488857.1 hypothetical protein [Pseudanabaena sp. CCNP1317]WGS74905.1 hypothetical protein OA858_24240 [Pseudanabaena galeata CCNP1313]
MFFKQIISIVLALTIFVAHTPPVFASNMISWGIPEINIQNALDGTTKFIETTKEQVSTTVNRIQLPNIDIPSASEILKDIKSIDLPDFKLSSNDIANLQLNLQATLDGASKATIQTYQQAVDNFDNVDLYGLVVSGVAVGAATYTTINKSLQGIPQDFSELLNAMPSVARRMRTAGMRGGVRRICTDAFQLFKKIPAFVESSEKKVLDWLETKVGSHIDSYANGGSSDSTNIFLENSKVNQVRGNANVKQVEIIRSIFRNGAEAIIKNSKDIIKIGSKATVTAVLIDEIAENSIHLIELASGEITVDEFMEYLQVSATKTAMSTAAFYTLSILAISFVPELTVPFFASPAIVAASQIVLGSRLAIPLITKLAAC